MVTPRGSRSAAGGQAGRVVGVEAPGSRGAGYLVAGRLVLTSAGATPQAGTPVTVRPAVSGRAFAAVVAWRGTPGGRDDGALVRVDDPAWVEVDDPQPAFGRVATDRPDRPGQVWGVPGPIERPEPITGSVGPSSRFPGDRFTLGVPGEPRAELPGAAVFCRGLLIGVVAGGAGDGQEDQPGPEVVPVSVLCREPGFAAAAGQAVPRLSPVELADAQLTGLDQPRSPSALLRADAQVVGFRGRHEVLDELGAWCSGAGVAALLLHGPGGQGKSRVGHELAGRLTAAGWATLWPDETASGEAVAAIAEVVVPLLIVVDGAESRPEQVRTLLQACARHDGARPLRVLLLARDAGDWWQLLRADPVAERLLDGASEVTLPELDDDPAGRADAYRQAVHDLSAALAHVPGYAAHNWPAVAARLTGVPRDAGGQALTVQTQALADLLDGMWPGPAADGRKTAEDRVLAHEQRYWSFTAAWRGLSLPEPALHDVLAVASLFGPTGPDQADQLLSEVAALAGQPRECRDAVRDWLADLYPGTGGRAWGTLQPDRIAERFAGLRLAESPDLPEPLLPVVTDSQRRRMLTVYARATRHPDLAGRLAGPLTDLCVRHADRLTQATIEAATGVAAAEPLITAVRRISADPDVPMERLALIGDRLPRLSPRLATLAAEVAQRIADQHRRAGRAAELATALNNLSIRLGDLGRAGPALAAIEEAVLIHRRLAGQQPETFEADLARSLSNLSVRLGELDQPEPALAAAEEATGAYRRLAERQPATFEPDLAAALMNLSLGLGALERYPQALAAIEESVTVYQRLGEERLDAFLPDLAAALSVLGISLGMLDRNEQSRVAAEAAVTIRRALAASRPDAFLPALATALTDLAVRHVVLGETEQAQAAIDEALTIRHHLVEKEPDLYAAELEWSLHVQGVILQV